VLDTVEAQDETEEFTDPIRLAHDEELARGERRDLARGALDRAHGAVRRDVDDPDPHRCADVRIVVRPREQCA